jgi:hypothetical protein
LQGKEKDAITFAGKKAPHSDVEAVLEILDGASDRGVEDKGDLLAVAPIFNRGKRWHSRHSTATH